MNYKQAIIIRSDLKLPKGKACAQAAHAAVEAVHRSSKEVIKAWRNCGQMKVTLKVLSVKELYYYKQRADDSGLTTALITDAGHTVVEPGTVTCLGIGPDEEGKIDAVVGKLKLL